jgi:hypothetical protein
VQGSGLEERLANQGRLGVRTAMFGGTPEQLALEKAIAEQQAGLGVSAMEQARAGAGVAITADPRGIR